MKEHSNEKEFKLIHALTKVNREDSVLDVACGSGIVACALARVARQVTGIDLTPAMIEQARILQVQKGLHNLTWQIGDANPLPYKESSYSLVVTRYSFHHFIDPKSVLDEMKRVCIPRGRVAVIDVTPPEAKAQAYNHMERLRDPSHVRALLFTELQSMMRNAGLTDIKTGSYAMETELEKILHASQTNPDDAEKIRQLFIEDLNTGSFGVRSYRKDSKIRFSFPITIMVGKKQEIS